MTVDDSAVAPPPMTQDAADILAGLASQDISVTMVTENSGNEALPCVLDDMCAGFIFTEEVRGVNARH